MKYELANVNPYVNYIHLCIKLLVGTFPYLIQFSKMLFP